MLTCSAVAFSQVGLSDVYERIRELETNVKIKQQAWVPPSRFVRATTKFWVKPEHATFLKCEIIKHLPISIFSKQYNFVDRESPQRPSSLTWISISGGF